MNCEIISAILIGVIIGILSSEGKDFINRIRFTNKIIQMIHKEIEMNIEEENRTETIRTSDIELNFPKYPSRKCAVFLNSSVEKFHLKPERLFEILEIYGYFEDIIKTIDELEKNKLPEIEILLYKKINDYYKECEVKVKKYIENYNIKNIAI